MDQVEREMELPAPPADVWLQVTDPEALGDWLEAEVELELRPGGAATFRFADGEVRRAMVREVDDDEGRFAFTWWPVTGPDLGRATTVTITIEPHDQGSRLRLVETTSARTRALAAA